MAKSTLEDIVALKALEKSSGGKGDNKEFQELVSAQIRQVLTKAKKEQERESLNEQRMLEESVQRQTQKDLARSLCPHKDERGASRLMGQTMVIGDGTIQRFLVCNLCTDEFHDPPIKSLKQKGAPPHLIPAPGRIGGQTVI